MSKVAPALRVGALRCAAHIAEAGLDATPAGVEEVLPPASLLRAHADGLPRVVAVTRLQCQGAFKDVFVYGGSLAGGLSVCLDPNELEDGAMGPASRMRLCAGRDSSTRPTRDSARARPSMLTPLRVSWMTAVEPRSR